MKYVGGEIGDKTHRIWRGGGGGFAPVPSLTIPLTGEFKSRLAAMAGLSPQ